MLEKAFYCVVNGGLLCFNIIKWVWYSNVVMYGCVINLRLCGNVRSALLIVIFANML